MNRRIYVLLWLLALLLPVLGYVWPLPEMPVPAHNGRDWHWPESQPVVHPEPEPALLARFWPVQQGGDNANHDNATSQPDFQPLRLVAVVRQGERLQALVLKPDGKLSTLSSGDALDGHRRVTAIEPTLLHWQDGIEHGKLALFPQPDVTENNNE